MNSSNNFPHIFSWKTSARAVWICILTLIPAMGWSIMLFGSRALLIWTIAALAAVVSEFLINLLVKRKTLMDGTALLSGLLIASAMPPTIPLYIPAISSAFALVVIKGLFGGLGSNWMNPALGGIAFAFINWPVAMKNYILPGIIAGVDGLSAATPITFARSLAPSEGVDILLRMQQSGFPTSSFDRKFTDFLNTSIFDHLGSHLPSGYLDLLLGLKPGALGDCALLFFLAGSIILFTVKIARFEAPLAMILSFSVLIKIFGADLSGNELLQGNLFFSLCTGSFLFCSFYCVTDPVTSPLTTFGLLLYGLLIGLICFLFYSWGRVVEGSAFAIIIANIFVPWIDKLLLPKIQKTYEKANL